MTESKLPYIKSETLLKQFLVMSSSISLSSVAFLGHTLWQALELTYAIYQ